MRGNLNKRGHIPTIVFFLGALVIVGYSFFVFASSGQDLTSDLSEAQLTVRNVDYNEAYIKALFERTVFEAIRDADKGDFENSFRGKFEEHAAKRDEQDAGLGNFFGRVRNRDYSLDLTEKEGTYSLNVENVFVFGRSGVTEIKRNFDLSLNFNDTGTSAG